MEENAFLCQFVWPQCPPSNNNFLIIPKKQVITLWKYQSYSIEQPPLIMKRKYLIKHPSQPHLQKEHSLLNHSQQSNQCYRPTFNPNTHLQPYRIKTEGPEPRSTSKEVIKLQMSTSSLKKSKFYFPTNKQNSKNTKSNKNIIRNTYNYNEARVSDFAEIYKNLDTTVAGNNRLSETINKKTIHKMNVRGKYKACSPKAVDYRAKEADQSFEAHPLKSLLKQMGPQPNRQIPSTCYKDLGYEDIIVQQLIGSGTFGKVFNARVKATGQRIALKKVQQDKKYKTRELEMLQMVDSPFIIKTLATFTVDQGKFECLNIAMQSFDQNFFQLLKQQNLTPIETKCYVYQMLRGLLYLHNKGVCHRDLKPQNMLVKNKRLVICDFGSAKVLKPGEENISYICSRCYRAPELIFQATKYTTQIDMWSFGCILLEILNERPLFIADSSLNHILEVIKILGTPTKDDVSQMNPNYDLSEYQLPKIKAKPFKNLFPEADLTFIDLIEKIVTYSPHKRLTPAQALAHHYFDDLRNERIYRNIPYFQGLELFFDFQNETLSSSIRDKLVPKWWRHNKK